MNKENSSQVVLGLLQNSWSGLYAGGIWPRESWLKALWLSRTGKRLKHLVDGYAGHIYFDNTTPIVGETPDSVVPADLDHITSLLNVIKPIAIVTFGRFAERAILELEIDIPVLFLPHPACRVVTNECFKEAAKLLTKGLLCSMALCVRGKDSYAGGGESFLSGAPNTRQPKRKNKNQCILVFWYSILCPHDRMGKF